jgi:CheY-like chemotaxis protein
LFPDRKIYKALVANDDPFQLRIIESLLMQTGQFTIDEAENGLVAYNRSRQRAFDVIILDLDMPIMSGFEACQKIRAYEEEGGEGITDLLQIGKNFARDESATQSLLHFNQEPVSRFQPLIIALSALITD